MGKLTHWERQLIHRYKAPSSLPLPSAGGAGATPVAKKRLLAILLLTGAIGALVGVVKFFFSLGGTFGAFYPH